MKARIVLCAAMMAGAARIEAVDRWEYRGDDAKYTNNELVPGLVQVGHDLERKGDAQDEDWYQVRPHRGRSYEARVFGSGVVWKYLNCPTCATFDLVDRNGVVITAGDNQTTEEGNALSVRWIANPSVLEFLRAKNGTEAPGLDLEKYDIQLVDTTLFLPRFNNTATQRTVLIIQSGHDRPVEGRISFRDASGAELHVQPFSIAAYGLLVLDTSSDPALAGRAGSAMVAHTGGQSVLFGKGVTLDPTTGFAFDTPLVGVDR